MRLLLYDGFDQAHVERGSAHCQDRTRKTLLLTWSFPREVDAGIDVGR